MGKEGETTKLAVMANNIEYIRRDLSDMHDDVKTLRGNFVTKEEFEPIKRLVYGLVSLILVAVVTAIMALLFKR